MVSFLACIGTMMAAATDLPQVSTGDNIKWYTIKNVRGNVYAAFTGSGAKMKLNSTIENESYLFYFTADENGGYKIHNAATSNLCAGHSSWTAEGVNWYLRANTNNNYSGVSISHTADFSGNNSWNDHQNSHTLLDYYSANDDGSAWVIEPYDYDANIASLKASKLQMSTDAEKHFYYIKNRRQNGKFANYKGANIRFTQTSAATAGSYWYFVDATKDLPQGTEIPTGCVACRIYNAGNTLAVENTSGNMTANSGVTWPAKIYFIRKGEKKYWDYVIYSYNEATTTGWNDANGTHVTNYDINDEGSIWSIEATGKSESDLIAAAATAKTNALAFFEAAEAADYFTYSDEAIATAKAAVKDLDVATNLVTATTSHIAIESAISTLKATQTTAGPVAGDRVMLKNRNYDTWLGMTTGWPENALCGKTPSTNVDPLLIWELKATDVDGVYNLYNKEQNVYAGPTPEWDNTNVTVKTTQAEAGKYQFVAIDGGLYAAVYDTKRAANANSYLHHSNWGNKEVIRYNKTSTASQWVISKVEEPVFNPTSGKMYALRENTTGLYVDIQTLGIHESGHTTNSMSLNYNPCIIYFEAGNGGKWKMKNINGTYAGNFTSGRDWNTTISSTAYEWTITAKDGDLKQLTIAKNASNYIGWDKETDITAGSALYNNAEGGNDKAARLYFTLVEYTSADLKPQGYYSLKLKDENNTFYLNFTESGDTKATLQNTPTYFHLLPSANKNYLIFQNKNNADQYLGHPAGRWETTYDCKLWQISEADEDGKVLISRHADVGSDGGKNFGTNESIEKGKKLYTNVKDNCKRWLIEGVFDYPTNGTVKNGNYEFKSAPIRYLNACNKIRFTLTESGAFFQNGAKRMSLDEFVLYDAKGKKVELTAKNVTGNNNKTYEGMFDGVNDKFAGTATWNDGTEDDYFEILLPKGVDLGGAFSFSFVTENTTMNAKAFKIETSYQKINSIVYTFVVDAPEGHAANATYNGSVIADDQTFEEDDFDIELFAADEISGYTWKVVVDDESATITLVYTQAPIVTNPSAVVALVKRIGGNSAADKFKFVLDPSINSKQETFVLGADESKILIKGSTLSAITTGLGWYLNNIAHINIAWNSLNEKTVSGDAYADLSNLPLPSQTETHTSDAKYRYYLNYCTFGYSMTSWTWKRWQQEIDWMALHGINMPLQIVGLEEVWRKFLTMPKYKYTAEQAKAFVPGPAFTAWWGMNNLEGWGGTGTDGWGGVQDDAWYQRQQALATQILARQRELGMEPVLPGFSGMVPSNFASKTGVTTLNPSGWGGFTRPHIIAPGNEKFAEIAKDYYQCLEEVMGTSKYYSMDPFHEGAGHLASVEGYATIYDAMEAAQPGSQWVIQQWQWDNGNQKLSLQGVPAGKLIVLDLFSDGKPEFDAYSYNGYAPQDAVFCVIPNFGGRSGLMGRLNTIAKNYFLYKAKHATIKGIGAAPEAIEQTPVTYDLLFQLPWMNGQEPDVKAWVEDYAIARYGKDNDVVKEAWELLREGVLNYGTDKIQGPVEDVWAARPNLEAYAASSWGSTLSRGYKIPAPENTYNAERRQMLIDAVYKLIDQEDELALTNGSVYKSNYMYDLVEFGGGVMADYAHYLLLGVRDAKNAGNTALYEARRDAFLQLILDMDAFRGTNLNFRLGKWTQEARDAAKEAKTYGATTANEDWYEFNNARTIITTWGDQSQNSGLKDYSYRSWQGLLADYYYPRWKYYFDNSCTDPTNGYFFFEWNWAHGMTHKVGDTQKSTTRLAEGAKGYSYSRTPEGNTVEEAKTMLGKYIIPIKYNDGTTYYAYRTFATDLTDKVTINVAAGATIDFAAYFGITNAVGTIKGDFVNGGSANMSQAVINAAEGTYTATITLTDGTELKDLTVTVEKAAINAGYYYINYNSQPMFIGYNEVPDEWDTDYANNQGYKGYKILGGAYTTNAEADKVFAIVPNGNGYSIAAQGKYLKAIEFNTWRHIQFSDNKDDAGKYVFHEVADIANAFKIQGVGENDGDWVHNDYMHIYNYDGNMIVGPNPIEVWKDGVKVGEAPTFTLTPITNYTVTIPEKGYLPLCLPFNVVLPEGVEACDINDLSKEKLALGSKGLFTTIATEGQIVKAGTPVILKGTANASYALGITLNNNGAKTSATGSVLRGNFVKQTLPTSSEVKRFVLNGENFEIIRGGIEIPANSCWIEANESDIKDDFIDLIPDYIEIGDWKFRVQETGKGLTITDCVATGSDHLVIGPKYIVNGVEKEVIAISDDFLYGNTALKEITLPATLTSVGNTHANYMFDITYSGPDEGAGLNIGVPEDENNADDYNASVAEAEAHKGVEHNCHYTVLGASTWRMTVNVTLDENVTHFNQYGSCLLATRENTLANDYSDGSMQLYLRADKGVVLKLDEDGDTYMFNNPKIYTNGTQYTGNTFTFVLENDGAGGYMAKMIYGDGREETLEITAADDAELHDFETIWSSLGTGITVNVQFDKLTNNGLFVGCTNLKAIHVAEGNPSFSGCEHGVLYNKAKTHIIRFPEGGGYTENGHRQFETPRSVTKVYAGALHGVDAHIVFHSNPEILHVAGHEEHMIAKYHLVIDDDADVVNFNSNNLNKFETVHYNRAFSNKDVYGTIMLPFVPNEESLSKITFFEFESGDANTLTFKEVTAVQPNTPYLFTMKEDGITSLEGGVTTITAVTNYTSENTNGNWTSVGCYKTGTVITNNAGETNSYYGLNNSKQFVRVSKKINTKPYRAYYKMAPSANGEAPAAKFSLIFRDGSTQVITPSQIEGWEENVYYDLMGRRVMNPTNGVYIVNGKKVIVK